MAHDEDRAAAKGALVRLLENNGHRDVNCGTDTPEAGITYTSIVAEGSRIECRPLATVEPYAGGWGVFDDTRQLVDARPPLAYGNTEIQAIRRATQHDLWADV